jgi:hypothetical protein
MGHTGSGSKWRIVSLRPGKILCSTGPNQSIFVTIDIECIPWHEGLMYKQAIKAIQSPS